MAVPIDEAAVEEVPVLTHRTSFFLQQRIWVLAVLCASSSAYGNSISGKFAARPLRFEENRGQAGASVRWVARSAGYTAVLSDSGITLRHSRTVRIAFGAGKPRPSVPQNRWSHWCW
jgi:hypothetical protein